MSLTRIAGIAREMIPSVDLTIKSAIRAAIGGALIWGSHLAPAGAAHWVEFGGKFLIMLAAIGFVGHAESVFAGHVAAKVRAEASRFGWLVATGIVMAICAVTLLARDWRTEDEID